MIIFKFLISTTTRRCRFERFANLCSSARKLFVRGEGEAHDLASAYKTFGKIQYTPTKAGYEFCEFYECFCFCEGAS